MLRRAPLIRIVGGWDLAEECTQDAFAMALERSPRDGLARRPGAWLTTTARNRAVDRLRRMTTEAPELKEMAADEVGRCKRVGKRYDSCPATSANRRGGAGGPLTIVEDAWHS